MSEYGLLTHTFNVGIAVEYGINEAIILNNLFFWVKKNEANGANFHDGRFWTYNSTKALAKLFPYFSTRQVRYALEKLKKEGLIMTGNYNKNGFDQTSWYALTDKGYELFGQVAPHLTILSNGDDNFGKSNGQDCQMDLPELANRSDNFGKPIPDINTDIDPYKNPDGMGRTSGRLVYDAGTDNMRPTVDEVRLFFRQHKLKGDPDLFFEAREFDGWIGDDGEPIADWRKSAMDWGIRRA